MHTIRLKLELSTLLGNQLILILILILGFCLDFGPSPHREAQIRKLLTESPNLEIITRGDKYHTIEF